MYYLFKLDLESITGMNFFPILKATPSNVCSVLDCESVVYYPKLWMNFMTGRYRGENTSVPWTVPKGFIIPGSNGFQAGKVSGIYDVDIEIGRFDYAMKKEIRELGARWDHEKKHWYIPAGIDISPFSDYYPIIPRGVSPKTMMTGVQISDAILQTKFSDKDIVKRLGAKWNGKNWNVEAGMDVTPFAKWNPTIPAVDESREPIYYFSRVFINVPFKDIDKVKGYGALWDKDIQRWYIPSGIDASLFSRWNPEVEGLTPISDAVVPSVDMEVDQVSDEDIIEPMHI